MDFGSRHPIWTLLKVFGALTLYLISCYTVTNAVFKYTGYNILSFMFQRVKAKCTLANKLYWIIEESKSTAGNNRISMKLNWNLMSYRLTKKKNYKFSYFGSQMFTFFQLQTFTWFIWNCRPGLFQRWNVTINFLRRNLHNDL